MSNVAKAPKADRPLDAILFDLRSKYVTVLCSFLTRQNR